MDEKNHSRVSYYPSQGSKPRKVNFERLTAVQRCAKRALRRMGNTKYKTGSTSCDNRQSSDEKRNEYADSARRELSKQGSICADSDEGMGSDSAYECAQACECDIPDVYPPGGSCRKVEQFENTGGEAKPRHFTKSSIASSKALSDEMCSKVVASLTDESCSDVEAFSRVGVNCLEECTDGDDSDSSYYGDLEKRSVGSSSSNSSSGLGDIAIAACCDEGTREECVKGEESDVTETITLSSVAEKLKNFQERCRRKRGTKSGEQRESKSVRQANRCIARRLRGKNTKFFCLW